MSSPFRIGTGAVPPGGRATIDLPVSQLANQMPVSLAVHVVHGERAGPSLFLSGAVHGDEIIGVEIIRRVLRHAALEELRGTLIAAPIVNTFGFLNHSRYMPDRRDLNRSFPGHDQGSLASLLADLFMREVAGRAQYGIDFHSAGLHRTNYPQIRIAPGDDELLSLGQAFAAPVILVSKLREGTLRQCARDRGIKVLLFEGGEALRFDQQAIEAGVEGVFRVMAALGMIDERHARMAEAAPAVSTSSTWVRAPEGGLLNLRLQPGERIKKAQVLGEITDPLGERSFPILAEDDGMVIGKTNLPIVHRGDALIHVARMKIGKAKERTAQADVPLFDEDEII
jgi:predicted deacylase